MCSRVSVAFERQTKTMNSRTEQRIEVLSRHLVQEPTDRSTQLVSAEPTSLPENSRDGQTEPSSSYERWVQAPKQVTMSTLPNSFSAGNYGFFSCRVHGTVPRHAVKWRNIAVVHKERLKDIKYQKGHGEGIAKVCHAR